jgi:ABC-type multidrug transport system ATPase subunit
MRIIKAAGVRKSYNGKTALSDVNLVFNEGECTALCGLNGAGKSTLIRLLAGVQSPDTGRIDGPKDFSIGYMPDHIEFPGGVCGREWLTFLGRLKGLKKETSCETLIETGLENAAGDNITGYSRGMVQRLLFSQMLLGDPDLLIMDEPESGLDPYWVHEWKNHMKLFREKGKTVIFSSHHLPDALEVAGRIIVFHKGRVVSDEQPLKWSQSGLGPDKYMFKILEDSDAL